MTPASVRFFGRRWFPAPLFIFISALMLGINERRLASVKRHFGIVDSETSWKRWLRWWRESFVTTLFWQQAKGYYCYYGVSFNMQSLQKFEYLAQRILFKWLNRRSQRKSFSWDNKN